MLSYVIPKALSPVKRQIVTSAENDVLSLDMTRVVDVVVEIDNDGFVHTPLPINGSLEPQPCVLGYTDEQVEVMNAEVERERQQLQNDTELVSKIHEHTERWLQRGKDMTIEDVVHGAVFTALMLVGSKEREKHPEKIYEEPKNMPHQLYADIRDPKRTDHFNTLMQNFIEVIS